MSSLENRVVIETFIMPFSYFLVNEPARDTWSKYDEENHVELLNHAYDGFSVSKIEPEKENTTRDTGYEITNRKFPRIHFTKASGEKESVAYTKGDEATNEKSEDSILWIEAIYFIQLFIVDHFRKEFNFKKFGT